MLLYFLSFWRVFLFGSLAVLLYFGALFLALFISPLRSSFIHVVRQQPSCHLLCLSLLKNTPTQVPSSLCISSLSRPQSNPCSTSSRDPCPFLDAGARCWSVFGVFPCFLAIHTNPHIKSCPLCLPRTCPCLICPPTFGPTSTLPLCLRL